MSAPSFDPALLGALYARHHAELFRYAARLTGDPDVAADVVQDAFVRLDARPPADRSAIRAWLFRAVTTIAIDVERTRRRRAGLVAGRADRMPVGEPPPDPGEAVERDDTRRTVRAALHRLDERDRAVLLMREEGFAHREIAEAVGTTTGSVGTMIARALDKLARELNLDGQER